MSHDISDHTPNVQTSHLKGCFFGNFKILMVALDCIFRPLIELFETVKLFLNQICANLKGGTSNVKASNTRGGLKI